jgi:methionyl-tRNA formyltransferase
MYKKESGRIDFTKPAAKIECLIRGMNPWPTAFTSWKGKTLKIWKARVIPENTDQAPGTVPQVRKDAFVVQTGEGCLEVLELQLEGKKRMDAEAFLRGTQVS